MFDSIINFFTENTTLSVSFIIALVAYIVFEVFWWLSSGSIKVQCKIGVNQLIGLFNHYNALIIDIRPLHDYNIGHIVDSVNLNPLDCNLQNAFIKSKTNHAIIIVCETGKGSAEVAVNMLKSGFKEVFYLVDGLNAWRSLGMPLVVAGKNTINHTLDKVIIYSKKDCPYCLGAKNLLRNKNIKYKEIVTSVGSPEFEEMIKLSGGLKTMPQIFINNNHIGGLEELKILNNNGGLDRLLQNI